MVRTYLFIGLFAFAATLLSAQSNLWGTSACQNDGVIYRTNGTGDLYTEVFRFNPYPGANPGSTRLVEATDGLFYGMTEKGGCDDRGMIFSYDPTTGTYEELHSFSATTGGNYPYGSLIQANDGYLYGMTSFDVNPNFGLGVLFRFDIQTRTYTELVQFTGTFGNGSGPYGDLLQASDDKLYGMTAGSQFFGGTLFSYDIPNDTLKVLHTFGSLPNDGFAPFGSLIQATNGRLYGMTSYGAGPDTMGTVFEYSLSTGYNQILRFSGIGGAFPGRFTLRRFGGRYLEYSLWDDLPGQ